MYHLATWGLAVPPGGEEMALKTSTSAWEGVYLGIKRGSVFILRGNYNEMNVLILQLPLAVNIYDANKLTLQHKIW